MVKSWNHAFFGSRINTIFQFSVFTKKSSRSTLLFSNFSGQLIRDFNWGPSQPNGGDQHCMYIVGGYLGYQWADFHCGFEMTFLCEYQVNDHQAWRRRRKLMRIPKIQNQLRKEVTTENSLRNQKYGYKNDSSPVPSIDFNDYNFGNEVLDDDLTGMDMFEHVTEKQIRDDLMDLDSANSQNRRQDLNAIDIIENSNVIVTKKPFRNSVVISTTTTRTTSTEKTKTSKQDWSIYNFLKSIVKLGWNKLFCPTWVWSCFGYIWMISLTHRVLEDFSAV